MPNGILEEQGTERFAFLLAVYAHAHSPAKNSVIQLCLLFIDNRSYRIFIIEKIVKKNRGPYLSVCMYYLNFQLLA